MDLVLDNVHGKKNHLQGLDNSLFSHFICRCPEV